MTSAIPLSHNEREENIRMPQERKVCTHGGKKITVVEQSVDEPVGEGGGGHGILRGGKGRVYQGVIWCTTWKGGSPQIYH